MQARVERGSRNAISSNSLAKWLNSFRNETRSRSQYAAGNSSDDDNQSRRAGLAVKEVAELAELAVVAQADQAWVDCSPEESRRLKSRMTLKRL